MKQLPIHPRHEALNAKFGEFAGFNMPLYYSKPIQEHHAVRKDAGVFDISHMGQFMLTGKRAEDMLNYALPSNVRGMGNGEALYSPLCREDGGVLDDLIIYRYSPSRYRIIVNAGTREQDFQWLSEIGWKFEITLEDISSQFTLFAIQGPRAFEKLAKLTHPAPGLLAYYTFREAKALGTTVFLARTGYTGEPGCEIAVPLEAAESFWVHLVEDLGITPIGLAARDTLRLEAAMPLYGHELGLDRHPWESGLSWTIDLNGEEDFVGKKALIAIKGVGFPHYLVGLEMTGRGIPREEYPVLLNGETIGKVTSGAISPTTGKAVALARIRLPHHKIGTALQVEIRGKGVEALVVAKPFYQNPDARNTTTGPKPVTHRKRIFH